MFRTYDEVIRTPCNSNKTQSEIYNCDLCDEGGWLSETDMQIHRKDGHAQELWQSYIDGKTFVCLACTKPQQDNKSLIQHVKSDHLLSSQNAPRVEREIFICDHCSHIFFNKTVLKCHVVKHILPARRFREKKTIISKCPKCKKRMKLSALWSHMEFHRLQSVSLCPICLEKCLNRADLKEHLKKHAKYYYCDMCGYRTIKENHFYDHVKTHRHKIVPNSEVDLQKYFKPTNRGFKPSDLVQYAIKGLMLFNNIHICILCREICTSTMQMKQHILCDHYTEKKVVMKQQYICFCGEEFFNNVLLKHHMFKNHQSFTLRAQPLALPAAAKAETSSNNITDADVDVTDEDNLIVLTDDYEIPIVIQNIDSGDIVHVT